ncbi:hypothetical protein CBR_g19640 [Chara braunii]|uniref:Small ribosomal subunit protein uS10 domain-containing protein n=1 Tax=Chara braunii TaxID=69332 RepID=A0A388KYI5_CHABU|nr:hypothetical protein CBR_g19640 [Chara braunii]|eukprot:GBG75127.1 hypothetical protein CBR_g19640 [Chara braunii]
MIAQSIVVKRNGKSPPDHETYKSNMVEQGEDGIELYLRGGGGERGAAAAAAGGGGGERGAAAGGGGAERGAAAAAAGGGGGERGAAAGGGGGGGGGGGVCQKKKKKKKKPSMASLTASASLAVASRAACSAPSCSDSVSQTELKAAKLQVGQFNGLHLAGRALPLSQSLRSSSSSTSSFSTPQLRAPLSLVCTRGKLDVVNAVSSDTSAPSVPKQKIRIKLRSYWVPLLRQASEQILEAVKTTNVKVVGPVPMPVKRRLYCVLRSPFADKDSREHFEIRTHKRLIDLENPTAETIDALMQLDVPAGVDVEVKLS